ncbi:MAG: hypothetical protein ACJA01_000859 [Saprospiraceae bacterium]|jgi:hypothetical protein
MKNITIVLLFIVGIVIPSQAQFGKLLDKAKAVVTGDEGGLNVAGGLKEALEVGVNEAVESLSSENGYFGSPYKILIPEDARKVISTVSKVPGFNNVEKDLLAKMNEAAEIAAKKAGPVFFEAIKQMTFQDATNILMGEKDAATRYLEETSGQALYKEFMPVIQKALDEVNARSLWKSAVDAYNKIPFQKKMNPDLDDHVNTYALKGMFSLVEKKEEGIRQDVGLRTSPILKEVFAKQDK